MGEDPGTETTACLVSWKLGEEKKNDLRGSFRGASVGQKEVKREDKKETFCQWRKGEKKGPLSEDVGRIREQARKDYHFTDAGKKVSEKKGKGGEKEILSRKTI